MAATTVGLALTRTLARRAAPRMATTLLRPLSTYYTPAHEYIKVEGSVGTVGITDFAQSALGDIVYVDLPEVDEDFEKGESFGSVESVKAASDVYAPVGGIVTETNVVLMDDPAKVNTDAEGDAWFIKMELSDASELEELMDEAAYKEHCEKEAH
mmetsp:Transcript_29498/g.68618  ORF Transcript_29498/g.68618 Transcript_29498/m.68618 type:complete len:155 (-) Transcript_29498:162-626(-)|eukprot:CAMPEP_0168736000 /NCGR_PEP_ID=MMETSP0724-20121128/9633_1 /TAXON_ID=265536 /ORGANISM="Amphiprora sp., Strain CCMP467" /LENGTH=154 /DNA_ID=CAMNT_0008783181 /DNA_START=106 /DNA_END=570 /DNA_ORIENTATION=-